LIFIRSPVGGIDPRRLQVVQETPNFDQDFASSHLQSGVAAAGGVAGAKTQTRNTQAGKTLPSVVQEKRKAVQEPSSRKKKKVGKNTSNCLGDSVQGNLAEDFACLEENNDMDVDEVQRSSNEKEDTEMTTGLVSNVFLETNYPHV
jgi:hypothetical protein